MGVYLSVHPTEMKYSTQDRWLKTYEIIGKYKVKKKRDKPPIIWCGSISKCSPNWNEIFYTR